MDTAVLGGGCFWCLEAAYKRFEGVVAVAPGFGGGSAENPTYKQVCTGETGHAEIVKIDFDPEIIAYEGLLDIFWKIHDPTTRDRQGEDVGTQYRSMILYRTEDQKRAAEASLAKAQSKIKDRIVTEIKPLEKFWPAEEYHKDYYDTHRSEGYCRLVIAPKLKKLGFE
jgi:peptide-methionine (S)-S-oxide reductase